MTRAHASAIAAAIALMAPAAAFAGSWSKTTPGADTFLVPDNYETLTVEVWGGGGAGTALDDSSAAGQQSSWNGSVVGNGGSGGTRGVNAQGAPGTASGGDTNITGGTGTRTKGGDAPNGGIGGSLEADGSAPGAGGGPGSNTASDAAGGGSGGYARKTYAAGALPAGAGITVVVGRGGQAANGGTSGADGSVVVTWTDAPPAPLSCTVAFDKNPVTTGDTDRLSWSATGAPAAFYIKSYRWVTTLSGTTDIPTAPVGETDYSGTVYRCASGTFDPDTLKCSPSASDNWSTDPLYQFISHDGWDSHFYSASRSEKDSLVSAFNGGQNFWHYHGIVAWLIPSAHAPVGTVHLRRFYKGGGDNSHFYTTLDSEASWALANGYGEESMPDYIYPPTGPHPAGTVPLYRAAKGSWWNDYMLALDTSFTSFHSSYWPQPIRDVTIIGYVYPSSQTFDSAGNTVSSDPETARCPAILTVREMDARTPTAPSIVSAGGSCVVGSPYTVSLTSTSPTSAQIRYLVDWNADASIEGYLPPSGFVPSGGSQSTSTVFTVSGTHYIAASAQDINGLSSGTTTFAFSCSASGGSSAAPNDPSVFGDNSCVIGSPYAIGITSASPSNGNTAKVRYLIDWADGGPLQVDPPPPPPLFVSSTTLRTVTHRYAAGGPYRIKVSAQDENGNHSGTTTMPSLACIESCIGSSCPCPDPSQHRNGGGQCVCSDDTPPINGSCGAFGVTLTVRPLLVRKGERAAVSWRAEHVSACNVSGTNGDGGVDNPWACGGTACNVLNTRNSRPITSQTVYTLSCTGLDDVVVTLRKTVNILPFWQEN